MKIREGVNERAEALTNQLQVQAQAKYIEWLMKEEECDRDMAWAIVEGRTDDPEDLKYQLGFKMANPVLCIALFKQRNEESRRQAARNFAMQLDDREKEYFFSEVFDMETASGWEEVWKAEEKKARKEAKKAKREKS